MTEKSEKDHVQQNPKLFAINQIEEEQLNQSSFGEPKPLGSAKKHVFEYNPVEETSPIDFGALVQGKKLLGKPDRK